MKKAGKELIKNYGILAFSNIGCMIFGFFYSPIIIHSLNLNEYGTYTIALSLFAIGDILSSLVTINVIGPKIIRYKHEGNQVAAKSYYIYYLTFICLYLMLSSILVLCGFILFYHINDTLLISAMILSNVFAVFNTTSRNLSMLDKNFIRVGGIPLLRSVLKFIAVLTLTFLSMINSAKMVAFITLFSEIVTFIVMGYGFYIELYKNYKGVEKGPKVNYKNEFSQNAFNFSAATILDGYTLISTAIMKQFLGVEMVAVNGIINTVVRLVSTFASSFETSILPNLVVWVKEKKAGINISKITNISAIIVIFGVVLFNVFASPIVTLYAGEQYIPYLTNIRVASLSVIIIPLQMTQRVMIYSIGRIQILFHAVLAGTIVKIIIIATAFITVPQPSLIFFIVANIIGDIIFYLIRRIGIKGELNNEVIYSNKNYD